MQLCFHRFLGVNKDELNKLLRFVLKLSVLHKSVNLVAHTHHNLHLFAETVSNSEICIGQMCDYVISTKMLGFCVTWTLLIL